jgi:homoserine kinase
VSAEADDRKVASADSAGRFFRITVPASSANLGPGFDCLGIALDIRDSFAVEVAGPGQPALTIEVRGAGAPAISSGPDNLVYRAFKRVLDYLGRDCPPVRMEIDNAIPCGCGLGSSAAAIVAGACLGRALVQALEAEEAPAANEAAAAASPSGSLTKKSLDDETLVALATGIEGHPDNVAAAFHGGLTISTSAPYGGVFVRRCQAATSFGAVVAVPDFAFSTDEARSLLPSSVSMTDAVFNIGRTATLVAGLLLGDARAVRQGMADRLHQPYRAKAFAYLSGVIEAAIAAGAAGAALSGAGPSVLAIVETGGGDDGGKVGRAMVEAFGRAGHQAVAYVSGIAERGVVFE